MAWLGVRYSAAALTLLAINLAWSAPCVDASASTVYVSLPGNADLVGETARAAGASTVSFSNGSFGTQKINFSVKSDPTNGAGDSFGIQSPEPPYIKVSGSGSTA